LEETARGQGGFGSTGIKLKRKVQDDENMPLKPANGKMNQAKRVKNTDVVKKTGRLTLHSDPVDVEDGASKTA
jgi:hypothetical protein